MKQILRRATKDELRRELDTLKNQGGFITPENMKKIQRRIKKIQRELKMRNLYAGLSAQEKRDSKRLVRAIFKG
jgi:hypothetical protein